MNAKTIVSTLLGERGEATGPVDDMDVQYQPGEELRVVPRGDHGNAILCREGYRKFVRANGPSHIATSPRWEELQLYQQEAYGGQHGEFSGRGGFQANKQRVAGEKAYFQPPGFQRSRRKYPVVRGIEAGSPEEAEYFKRNPGAAGDRNPARDRPATVEALIGEDSAVGLTGGGITGGGAGINQPATSGSGPGETAKVDGPAEEKREVQIGREIRKLCQGNSAICKLAQELINMHKG